MDSKRLSQTHARATQTIRKLQEIAKSSADRLRNDSDGGWPVPLPSRATWSFRPTAWGEAMLPASRVPVETGCKLADGVSVYHDCPLSQISLRQIPNERSSATAPFSLLFDVLHFEGSYLSFAIAMPKEAVPDVTRNDLIRLQASIELEASKNIFVRLNVRNGPNVEQISRHLDLSYETPWVEFDLYYSSIEFHLISDIWIDLILEQPAMNSVRIDDLTLIRRPRASI